MATVRRYAVALSPSGARVGPFFSPHHARGKRGGFLAGALTVSNKNKNKNTKYKIKIQNKNTKYKIQNKNTK